MGQDMLKMELVPRLALTLALHQSQAILQMSQLELAQWLNGEIEKNPVLRLKERGRRCDFLDTIPARVSLYDSLLQQIEDSFASSPEKEEAQVLLEQLDEKGYLPETTPDSPILEILHTFTPAGIFARNLRECLLLQLKKGCPGYGLIESHFDALMQKKWALLKKKMGPKLQSALQELQRCTLRPGVDDTQCVASIVPDLSVERLETGWGLKLV